MFERLNRRGQLRRVSRRNVEHRFRGGKLSIDFGVKVEHRFRGGKLSIEGFKPPRCAAIRVVIHARGDCLV